MSGVNSINWARIVVQVVYYFYSHFRLSEKNKKSVFSVPTGNFGDIYAGYIASKMGLPISKLIIATNENDLLCKFLKNGIYRPSKVKFSISPSMDIQVASNFERLISSYYNNNSKKISTLMKQLSSKGCYKIDKNTLKKIKNIFYSNSVNSKDTKKTIKIVYYFYSHFRLSERNKRSVFSVPTGNFGDIYAGYIAYKMGLPISKLIIAVNENNLLYKFLKNGIYKPSKVKFSISPSMDIQVASNFERLISSYYNNNSKKISELMNQLTSKGSYKIDKIILKKIRNIFYSKSINAENTKKTIKLVYQYNHKILDPHTSVGLKALEEYYLNNIKKSENLFCLETAHPAKFGETIYKILRKNPVISGEISKNLKKKEFFKVLPNNLNKIKNYIRANRLH